MATKYKCKKALQIHEETLSRLRHVVGLGIVPLEEGKKPVRDYAVGVYVTSKVPFRKAQSKKARLQIPSVLRIPGRKGELEVPVRIIEQGEVSFDSAEFELE